MKIKTPTIQLPMVECGYCGELSRMRVDAHRHPLDRCPKCKEEGFMQMPGQSEKPDGQR